MHLVEGDGLRGIFLDMITAARKQHQGRNQSRHYGKIFHGKVILGLIFRKEFWYAKGIKKCRYSIGEERSGKDLFLISISFITSGFQRRFLEVLISRNLV